MWLCVFTVGEAEQFNVVASTLFMKLFVPDTRLSEKMETSYDKLHPRGSQILCVALNF